MAHRSLPWSVLALTLGTSFALVAGCGDDESTTDGPSGGAGTGASSSGGNVTGTGGGTAGGGGGAVGGAATGGNGGQGGTPGFTVSPEESWHSPSLAASLHFSPNGETQDLVLDALASTTSKLRLAFFNIRLDEVRDQIIALHQGGIDVGVILDQKTQDLPFNTTAAELIAAGVPVTLVENTSATNATMHNKFAIIDDQLVLTGSANYSFTALNVSDEDIFVTRDASLAARFNTEYDEIVAGGTAMSAPYPANTPVQAWMGPEDDLHDIAVAEMDAAQTHLLVGMFQLNQQLYIDAIIDAHNRGVTTIVVLDEVQASEPGADADEQLAAAGVPVFLADNMASDFAEMHSKFAVIDHQRVVMGSLNWTNLGSFFNDENLLVIDDANLADRAEGKFAELLDEYVVPSPSSLGLDEGAQPVVFEVGNVTLDPGTRLVVLGTGPLASGIELVNGTAMATFDAGTDITYHYSVFETATGTLLGSSIDYRFTVPYAPGPFGLTDAFVVP